MVDQSDLAKVTQLNAERNTIMFTLDLLHEDGRVINMTVGKPGRDEDGEVIPNSWILSFSVNTEYMEYPPQMKDAIMDFLGQRCIDIGNELSSMGLTGFEEPRPRGPEPTNEKPKAKSKRRAA